MFIKRTGEYTKIFPRPLLVGGDSQWQAHRGLWGLVLVQLVCNKKCAKLGQKYAPNLTFSAFNLQKNFWGHLPMPQLHTLSAPVARPFSAPFWAHRSLNTRLSTLGGRSTAVHHSGALVVLHNKQSNSIMFASCMIVLVVVSFAVHFLIHVFVITAQRTFATLTYPHCQYQHISLTNSSSIFVGVKLLPLIVFCTCR